VEKTIKVNGLMIVAYRVGRVNKILSE